MNHKLSRHFLIVAQGLLALIGLAMFSISCYSPQPAPRQPSYSPRPTPYRVPPPPPRDPCAGYFDPCTCDLEKFRVELLDERLESPGNTPTERGETAANLRKAANDFKNEYWSTRQRNRGILALRFYDGYLRLVPPSDRYAPFALLQSTSIYCGLGCPAKAKALAEELQYTYRHNSAEIDKALAYCR